MVLSNNYAYIYDTWFFFLLYFNNEYFKNSFEQEFKDSNTAYEGVDYVLSKVESIPPIIGPFFKLHNKEAVLQNVLKSNVRYGKSDVDYFIDLIKTHSGEIYSDVIEYNFRTPENSDADITTLPDSVPEFINALNKLDLPEHDKLQLSLLLKNFDYAISVLIETIYTVYDGIKCYHDEKSGVTNSAFEKAQTANNISQYEKFLPATAEALYNATISISLLNPYIVFNEQSDEFFFLLLGQKHDFVLSKSISSTSYSAAKFVSACGNEMRVKMLEGLAERGEMTLTEFSEYTNLPPSTMTHNIRIMLDAGVLEISRAEPKCIYYYTNPHAVTQVQHDLNILFDKLLRREK